MLNVLIVVVAIIIATLSVIAGLGGGILLIPILTLGFGIPLHKVVASVLISLVFPATIGAIGAYRRKEIDFNLAVRFEIPTAIGVFFGAKFSSQVQAEYLQLLFAVIAFLLSTQMINKAWLAKKGLPPRKSFFWKKLGEIPPFIHMEKRDVTYRISLPSLTGGGLLIGFLSGMLGVGGGWIKTPLLVLAFGVPPIIASGTSIFMIAITALIGGITHISEGNTDLELTLTLIVGLGIGALIGNYLKPKFESYQVSMIIGIILILVSIAMFANSVAIFMS